MYSDVLQLSCALLETLDKEILDGKYEHLKENNEKKNLYSRFQKGAPATTHYEIMLLELFSS